VTIGGTGVAADTTGYGGVSYSYLISRYEVTGAEFGAAVTADSRVGTYVSQTANSSAEYISWYEAAKYCNWKTSGDAYLGAYTHDVNGTFMGIDRASAISMYGIVYALPTENEWYKAAYWRDDVSDQWSLYANGTDATPTWGTTAGWNYRDGTYGYATANQRPWEVGYGAQEQNGTYDMMGNVWEWVEDSYNDSKDVLRGGSNGDSAASLSSVARGGGYPDREYSATGFRVVMIPEPGTALLFGIGGIGAWLLRRNRVKSRESAE
jgi:formylglycine-generating enzyme required for sulfatase activity